ncbi:MAG: hypothetical protein V8T86_17365 [Victivallis sp.]
MMVENCKWMSSLKEVEYTGAMKDFEPVTNTSHTAVTTPFTSTGTLANRLTLQRLENSIIHQPEDPKQYFWNDFLKARPQLIEEVVEANSAVVGSLEHQRRPFGAGGRRHHRTGVAGERAFMMRSNMNLEGVVSRYKIVDNKNVELVEELGKLECGKNGN